MVDGYGYWGLAACYDWYETNEKMWFCLSDKNGICEVDKHTGKIRILGMFPNKPLNQKALSISIAKNKEQLVFAPFSADDIAIYDIKKQELRFYPVQIKNTGKKVIYSEKEKFFSLISYDDYIFLVGRTAPVIVRLCIDSGNLEYFDQWLKVIDEVSQESCINAYFSDGYALIKGYIYIGLSCTNSILKINPKTMEWELIRIECGLSGFGGVLQVDDTIWLSGIQYGEDILVKINLKTKTKDEIKIPYHGSYLSPFYFGNGIYLAPIEEQKLYRYSIENAIWNEVKGIGNNKKISDRENRVIAYKTYNNGFTLITGNDRKWRRFGFNGIYTEDYFIKINDREFMEKCSREVMNKDIVLESEYSLNTFLTHIERTVE